VLGEFGKIELTLAILVSISAGFGKILAAGE